MDLQVIEIGNGGDIFIKGKDLALIEGFGNMPYLGMFGGNVEQSTPSKRLENEQDFSFWANNLLFTPDISFNSLTERTLKNTALTSNGRIEIENAVKKDLEFMRGFADITVSVNIPEVDRLKISIIILELDNQQEKEFIYIWDGSRLDLQSDYSIPLRTLNLDPAIGDMIIGYNFIVR